MLAKFLEVAEFIDSAEVGKILVELQAGVNDASFEQNPPVVQVYVLPERYEEGLNDDLNDPNNVGGYVSTITPSEHRTFSFSMPMEEKPSRWRKRSSANVYGTSEQIWVLVVPDGKWIEYYDPTWFPVRVRRGRTVSLTISLAPKDPHRLRRRPSDD